MTPNICFLVFGHVPHVHQNFGSCTWSRMTILWELSKPERVLVYRDIKNLIRRTSSDKILRDKAFNIAKNPKYDRYQHGLASIVYIFLIKKLLVEQSKT